VVCAVTATGVLDLSGASGSSGTTFATGVPLTFTGATLPAATQYAAYSQSLASHVSGGVPPYTYAYVSGGANVGYAMSGANLTVTPNIPITESVVVKVTDSTSTSKSATFTLPINYVIPAGAQALGYTQLQWILLNPNLSDINMGPYANTTVNDLYNGVWGTAPVPLSSNYSMVNGILQGAFATSGSQTNLTTENTNGSGPPTAGNLGYLQNANGWYIDFGTSVTSWTSDNWFAVWLEAWENCNVSGLTVNTAGGQAAFLKQWLEIDVWESGYTSGGYQGAIAYHNGVTGTQSVNFIQNLPYFTNPTQTVPQVYGASYAPANGNVAWYINNVTTGNKTLLNNSGGTQGSAQVCNATSLAWINTQGMYAKWSWQSHGANTPYSANLYYVAAFGPPGPAAYTPQSLQVINQGGPNASQQGFYTVPFSPGSNSGSATGLGISANYQGLSWLPPSTGTVTQYNIYRNGTLYDSVATPITITGYIAPGTDSLGQSVGILHVSTVSGGSSSNSISDGKILCGLKLISSATGFVAGTKVVAYSSAADGGGGTGNYYVDQSQTVGSSGSLQTFQGWSYNDTASTNCIPFNFSGVASIYKYSVTSVVSGVESAPAYPAAYMYQGISMTGQAQFSYGGTVTWNDTSGAPVNGPYDVKQIGGGYQPVWCGANGDANNHTYMCPTQHFEAGGFNYLVFDIKPVGAVNTYQIVPLLRSYGVNGGVDGPSPYNSVNFTVNSYATPALAVGQWSTVKIPFSALCFGVTTVQASFQGVAQYAGKLTIHSFTTMGFAQVTGCVNVTGAGIPANTYTCGSPNGGASGWTDPQAPYTGAGPWVFNVWGPNIVGTENVTTETVTLQGSMAYKTGWPGSPGTFYLNNIGFTTV
jgi:hypothetical protein